MSALTVWVRGAAPLEGWTVSQAALEVVVIVGVVLLVVVIATVWVAGEAAPCWPLKLSVVGVALRAGGGGARLATVKLAVSVWTPALVVTSAVIEWLPSVSWVVSKSVALPFAAVVAKSKGAAFSVTRGVPVAVGLSSQKRTWVAPVAGVVKTAMLPATVAPPSAEAGARVADELTCSE